MNKPKAKVLLVEDDMFLANIYQKKFELEGFKLIWAEDGEKALRLARREGPQAVLLDILLPKLDGLVVLSRLKADAATTAIPIIMLSNLGQKDEVDKALKLGAVDYLVKAHFKPSEVVAKVEKVLGDHQG